MKQVSENKQNEIADLFSYELRFYYYGIYVKKISNKITFYLHQSYSELRIVDGLFYLCR